MFPRAYIDHLPCLQAVDGGRALVRHPDPQLRPLVYRHVGDILSFEDDPPTGDPILRETHDGHEQGCLAGTVRTEKDMRLPGLNFHVDMPEYFLVTQFDPEVFDDEHGILLDELFCCESSVCIILPQVLLLTMCLFGWLIHCTSCYAIE